MFRRGSRAWLSEVSACRRRRRLRCWLGLPMRALLDPIVRESLVALERLVFDRERELWLVPGWGLSAGGLSPVWVDAVRRCGLVRSLWWWEVPVDLTDACGCWAIGPGCVPLEEVGVLSEWVGIMRVDELRDLLAECALDCSAEARAVSSLCRRELCRRGVPVGK